jgi:hypothetical protein
MASPADGRNHGGEIFAAVVGHVEVFASELTPRALPIVSTTLQGHYFLRDLAGFAG